ncbi:ABC transporter substrate-binding protein [Calothrix sp. PCC 6303]|uniref:ABC transporter substrate-binding protein n=1 Tax=Calothrix sp. PCC 6303 TaxID=1170562 RepID=UPI0002A006B8|nr:ABC transporter substrate-binding protein [Calothrix sp. PCC 6303]AFZ02849.1 periplasmic binding protein [Calothrix sp. PCC 6303]
MNQKTLILIFAALLSINLFACSNTDKKSTINKTESLTNTQTPIQQAQRVVALTPLAADLIYKLDKTKLVGVPSGRYTDVVAKAKFADFPRVGRNTAINIEKIVSLKPDLVIGSEGFHDQILGKLKELGIQTRTGSIRSWQDLNNQTKEIAKLTGTDPKPILDKFESYLNNIPQNGQKVLVLARPQPTSSPNKNSWAGDLLTKFNYKNLVADLESNGRFPGYLTLSQEKILEANPDKIFLIESGNLNPEEFKKLPYWNKLKAVQTNQVYTFHHDGLISPTSVDTVEQVTKQLREVAEKSRE